MVALLFLYDRIVLHLLQGIRNAFLSGALSPASSELIVDTLQYEKWQVMVLAGTGVLMLASVFGWMSIRLARDPNHEALQSQKRFIGNVAHELRTPLAIIKTNTEVALFNEGISPDVRKTLQETIEELDRISDIINNLLSMNVLLRPDKTKFENVDLGVVVDRVVRNLSDLARHRQIEVTVKKSDYRTVWGNMSGLEQIVMNVTRNAINYSGRRGYVLITIEPNYQGEIALTISDTGVGISEEELFHVFEPFFRGDRARGRTGGSGSGLGLAIVSELLKLHKGKIAIRSVLGEGTTVSISLPCGRHSEAAPKNGKKQSEIAVDFSDKN